MITTRLHGYRDIFFGFKDYVDLIISVVSTGQFRRNLILNMLEIVEEFFTLNSQVNRFGNNVLAARCMTGNPVFPFRSKFKLDNLL